MLAVLTPSGLAALEAAAPVHVDSVRRRILDHLDARQLDAMAGIFAAIRAGLDGCTSSDASDASVA
jgi:hypothetical protein